MEENRGQEMILDRQKWYGCQKRKEMKVACPIEGKVQQKREISRGRLGEPLKC